MSLFYSKETESPKFGNIIIAIVLFIVGWILISMAIMPSYRIYKQNKQGEANLRQQEWE